MGFPRQEYWSGVSLPSPSLSVVFSSLQPHGLQRTRPPCLSPTPGVYSNSCLPSRWCHLTISSSVVPFSSCFQSFPASGSFQMSQFFPSGGQSVNCLYITNIIVFFLVVVVCSYCVCTRSSLKRKWQPTPVFLPGKPHGQRNLAGYNPWGHKTVWQDLQTEH